MVYVNLNLVPITDFFGGVHHSVQYTMGLFTLVILICGLSYFSMNRYARG